MHSIESQIKICVVHGSSCDYDLRNPELRYEAQGDRGDGFLCTMEKQERYAFRLGFGTVTRDS